MCSQHTLLLVHWVFPNKNDFVHELYPDIVPGSSAVLCKRVAVRNSDL